MKTYRNGSAARILCTDRPNTSFCVLSMDKDGVIYHHKADGKCTSEAWDLMDLEELTFSETAISLGATHQRDGCYYRVENSKMRTYYEEDDEWRDCAEAEDIDMWLEELEEIKLCLA